MSDEDGVEVKIRTTFSCDDSSEFKLRTHQGGLEEGKTARQRNVARPASSPTRTVKAHDSVGSSSHG